MPQLLDDLIGLNMVSVHDMPVVGSQADAEALVAGASNGQRLAAAGMRHCQGGHTAVANGRVLITETMRKVTYNDDETFTAQAGATWAQIHHTLVKHGRAPLVHQSSGHFTVGGSLGANCHGRDPSQGPLADTVTAVTVLCGDGKVRKATPSNEHKDLFSAVVGGYGACGLILEATFKTTRNQVLEEIWEGCDAAKYKKVLAALPKHAKGPAVASLHYGWLCCLGGNDFLDEVVYADYVENTGGVFDPDLKEEAWGMSELLRASWAAASESEQFHATAWKEIKALKVNKHLIGSRLNWMRASVSFTASRGHPERAPTAHRPDSVAMLQEYFVPLEKFLDMLATMRKELAPGNAARVRLLTCTVRWVQQQQVHTALNYAPEARVCLALEAMVPLDRASGLRAPTAAAKALFQTLLRRAHQLGGSYYLPYYPFADLADFQAAYGTGAAELKAAMAEYDPDRKFDNVFLSTYLPTP